MGLLGFTGGNCTNDLMFGFRVTCFATVSNVLELTLCHVGCGGMGSVVALVAALPPAGRFEPAVAPASSYSDRGMGAEDDPADGSAARDA